MTANCFTSTWVGQQADSPQHMHGHMTKVQATLAVCATADEQPHIQQPAHLLFRRHAGDVPAGRALVAGLRLGSCRLPRSNLRLQLPWLPKNHNMAVMSDTDSLTSCCWVQCCPCCSELGTLLSSVTLAC